MIHTNEYTGAVPGAIEDLGEQAMDAMPTSLPGMPQERMPPRAFDTVVLPALRALLTTRVGPMTVPMTSVAGASEVSLTNDDWRALAESAVVVVRGGEVPCPEQLEVH